MEYNTAYDFFIQEMWKIQKSIVPLYRRTLDPLGLEYIGSSTYCIFGPIRMLVSAAHVLKCILPNRAWYPYSNQESRELPCEKYAFSKNQTDDVCIMELVADLPNWSPLPSMDFSEFNSTSEYQHILLGYPASSAKGSTAHNQHLEIKGYLTSPSPAEEYGRLGVDPNREFVVEFRKKKVFERDLHQTTFPNPNGMSGGPVLQFHEKSARIQKLVGIMNRWDLNRKKAIVATRIETITKRFSVVKVGPLEA
jgi:hypothetical protein